MKSQFNRRKFVQTIVATAKERGTNLQWLSVHLGYAPATLWRYTQSIKKTQYKETNLIRDIEIILKISDWMERKIGDFIETKPEKKKEKYTERQKDILKEIGYKP